MCYLFSTPDLSFIFCFAVFGDFYFFLAPENVVFGVFVFCDFTICFAIGGARRKLQNHKKRKHQKTHFQEQEKNKNHQKQQNRKYFEYYFPDLPIDFV